MQRSRILARLNAGMRRSQKRYGYTPQELARLIGIKLSMVEMCLNGTAQHFVLRNIVRICAFLGWYNKPFLIERKRFFAGRRQLKKLTLARAG